MGCGKGVCPLPFMCCPAHTPSPFACMWGHTVTCCQLLFAPLLWCAHHPTRTPSPLHAHGGTLSPFCTPALVCPPFCLHAAPPPGWCPTLLACPLHACGGTMVMVWVAPSLIPCALSPCA